MLMVVFGAGASYDSCPTHPPPQPGYPDEFVACRLPLGDRLFEERALFYPILERFSPALEVAPRLRHLLPNTTVEQVMAELLSEAGTHPRRHAQLAAIRYYLQSAIGECDSEWDRRAAHGVTNYKSLLDMIEHRRKRDDTVCLVNFNYDTMLDVALRTVGIELRAIDDYVSSNYKVIKVHGSVNWGREVEPPIDNIGATNDDYLVRALIEQAASVKLTDRFHLANQRPMVRLDAHRPLTPAIAIPVQTKGAFECPGEHIDILKDCLKKVERILVIGWAANDAHFLNLLRDGRQAIRGVVVAGQPELAAKVIGNLSQSLDQPRLVPSAGGFTYFTLHEAQNFLDAV